MPTPRWLRLSAGEKLRLVFSDLGTTFNKVGQLLSTRSDVVEPEVAAELAKLRSRPAPTISR